MTSGILSTREAQSGYAAFKITLPLSDESQHQAPGKILVQTKSPQSFSKSLARCATSAWKHITYRTRTVKKATKNLNKGKNRRVSAMVPAGFVIVDAQVLALQQPDDQRQLEGEGQTESLDTEGDIDVEAEPETENENEGEAELTTRQARRRTIYFGR